MTFIRAKSKIRKKPFSILLHIDYLTEILGLSAEFEQLQAYIQTLKNIGLSIEFGFEF